MAKVFLPPAVRYLAGGQSVVEAAGGTVREVLVELEGRYPGIRAGLCDGEAIRPGLSVSIGDAVTRLGLRQPVSPQAEIHFLPAIGGG